MASTTLKKRASSQIFASCLALVLTNFKIVLITDTTFLSASKSI